MKKKLCALFAGLLLASCAGEITPEQATQGAEAARAWLEVAREARVIIRDDK